jgi:hypothetical protein
MVKLLEAGVDWLRVTSDSSRVQSALARIWSGICTEQESDGGILVEAGVLGYTGAKINGQFYGSRSDGTMLNLSGTVAARWYRQVLATGCRVTRLDLQCTVVTDEYDGDFGERQVAAAFKRREAEQNRNWAKIRLLKGYGEGDTVKVGSRTSGKYGRLYDKQKESNDDRYERCWRYEVEYKDEIAPAVAADLLRADDDTRHIIGVVRGQYDNWGFAPVIPGGLTVMPPRPGPRTSDTQKTLDWLCIQVRPSIGRLLDAGIERATIIEVLGLSWDALNGATGTL